MSDMEFDKSSIKPYQRNLHDINTENGERWISTSAQHVSIRALQQRSAAHVPYRRYSSVRCSSAKEIHCTRYTVRERAFNQETAFQRKRGETTRSTNYRLQHGDGEREINSKPAQPRRNDTEVLIC